MPKAIEEIVYQVTDAFGACKEGSLRRAFLIAEDTDAKTVLIFHPKDHDGCGNLEFGMVRPDKVHAQRKNRIYVSHRQGRRNRSSSHNLYVNLEPAQEKMYRQLVTQAGLKIPRSLALSAD